MCIKMMVKDQKLSPLLFSYMRGVPILGSRKLTYLHGGKRKYSVISTDFGHKNSDGNGNIIF